MLDADAPNKVRLSVTQALVLGETALSKLGLAAEEASIVTAHLVDAMLCGYAFAGLPRILAIADAPELARPRKSVAIVHETPLSARVDGGNHLGYLAVLRAADIAIEKARGAGVAIVGVHDTWFSGRNSYYIERIARAGLVAIHAASAPGAVVPLGASRPALGTNPIAFALPGEPNPYIFDMGTGATMWGEVLVKALLDEDLPDGVGMDAQGRPARSAREIVHGGVHPFAGHKGYGLSLTIQALCLLAGGSRPGSSAFDYGFLFIAFNPELLVPRERFADALRNLIAAVKALPRQPGVDEIRIPSERAFRERAIRRVEGVMLERRVYDALVAL